MRRAPACTRPPRGAHPWHHASGGAVWRVACWCQRTAGCGGKAPGARRRREDDLALGAAGGAADPVRFACVRVLLGVQAAAGESAASAQDPALPRAPLSAAAGDALLLVGWGPGSPSASHECGPRPASCTYRCSCVLTRSRHACAGRAERSPPPDTALVPSRRAVRLATELSAPLARVAPALRATAAAAFLGAPLASPHEADRQAARLQLLAGGSDEGGSAQQSPTAGTCNTSDMPGSAGGPGGSSGTLPVPRREEVRKTRQACRWGRTSYGVDLHSRG